MPDPIHSFFNTDLIIVGGGAAGLAAGITAGETGLRVCILERRHRAGLKILLCGNNRCNVTHDADLGGMLEAYGEPVAEFLQPSLDAFPPARLRSWFAAGGLRTAVHRDGRVFPQSEKADDVVHFFTDRLRELAVPLVLNCPVEAIRAITDGFEAETANLTLRSRFLLLATGGVSYPKTGSVGDGQRFAKALGHRVAPYRAGLAGVEFRQEWTQRVGETSLPATEVRILSAGRHVATTYGEILLTRSGARGPAMVNASRIIARETLRDVSFDVDLHPGLDEKALVARMPNRGGSPAAAIVKMGLLPDGVARDFLKNALRGEGSDAAGIARALKHWRLELKSIRPLKEAMVTVGGVVLEDIDPASMESRKRPGLYFAGEVMDVDGPTGGYNLHAAFSTARLAVASIARRLGKELPPIAPPRPERHPRGNRPRGSGGSRTPRSGGARRTGRRRRT